MYLRRCYRNKDGKRHGYWALVESYRSSRGPRQRVVAYLGEMDAAGRLSGPAAELGTWLRSVSMGVSVTMIQSVRERGRHLLQRPPHPVAVVRGLQRLLPSRSRFSPFPLPAGGF
jgi:hypothetical protein